MPNKNDTYDEVLTKYVQQLYLHPEEEVDLYRLIFPTVEVHEANGEYTKYAKDAALTAIDTKLTPENTAHRLRQAKGTGYFHLEDHAEEIPSWKVRDPEESSARHRRACMNTLMSSQFASNQKLAVDKLKAAVQATEALGAWSNNAGDPVADVEKLLKSVRMGCGHKANLLLMGTTAWNTIRNHPTVIARVAGLASSVSVEEFASMFSVRGLQVVIADTTVQLDDKDKTMCELLDTDVVALYNLEAPTEEDLSFGKCFTTYPSGPEVVTWVEHGITGVDTLLWAADENVTNPNACARLEVS